MNEYTDIDRVAYEMFQSGISLTKISEKLGIGRHGLTNRLKSKFDIQPIPNGRIYSCNDNIFESIDSEDKAYWLGFLMADGCVRNDRYIIDVGLAEKDRSHLVKMNTFLSSTYKIFERKTMLKDKEFTSHRTYFVSKKIVNDLKKYGCIENKTYKVFCIPEFSDYNLDRSFLRGYFDGDGSISTVKGSARISKMSLTSHTVEMLENIMSMVSGYIPDIKYTIYERSKGSYSLQFNMDSTRKMLYFMYDNSSIYLDRKYHIYKAYAVHIGNFVDYEWAKSVKPFMVGDAEESDSASVESRG